MPIRVRLADEGDYPGMADMHRQSFPRGWDAGEFSRMIAGGAVALVVEQEAAEEAVRMQGFLLFRLAAGEAELLTLAVHPAQRGQGVGRLLVGHFLGVLREQGAQSAFLEVEEGNEAALRLYQSSGFILAGIRPGYYTQGRETARNALVMRCDFD